MVILAISAVRGTPIAIRGLILLEDIHHSTLKFMSLSSAGIILSRVEKRCERAIDRDIYASTSTYTCMCTYTAGVSRDAMPAL